MNTYGFASNWAVKGTSILDTRTKSWREAGRNRGGVMEGFGLKFCLAANNTYREVPGQVR